MQNMLTEPHTTERNLIQFLMETLLGLPDVRAELETIEPTSVTGDRRSDAQIGIQVGGKSLTLLIETKKTVFPRDARQVLWQLREFGRSQPAGQTGYEVVPLLVAESISPGAKDLLREERIGYFDSGGSLFLPAGGTYLYIDKPAPKTLSKTIRSLFSGRRAQVLHAMLARHQDWFGVKELAEQAMVSPATASQVLTELDRYDWLDSRGQGPSKERRLNEPAMLLDTWVKQVSSIRTPTLHRYYVPAMKTENLLEQIGKVFDAHEIRYAVSYEAAAQRYAPFLTNVAQVRCRLLVNHATESAMSELGARVVSEGANLLITEAKSAGELLFREQVGGIWLDSPIQVYIDLLHGEGRAKEMAEHLRKERIGF